MFFWGLYYVGIANLLNMPALAEVDASESKFKHYNFTLVPDVGKYTCDELTRWLGTEKHYSNNKKEMLFRLLANKKCLTESQPVIILNDVAFGWSGNKRDLGTFYQSSVSNSIISSTTINAKSCPTKDEYVVAYLSNYSINNNFSHFLHGLLRLFCALIDAHWIEWNHNTQNFEPRVNYTIWLDDYFRTNEIKLKWISTLGVNIRLMKEIPKDSCITSKVLLYGSGCVKLLPPEKWFGYPNCRASSVLPAFGYYFRQQYLAQNSKDLLLVDEHLPNQPIGSGLRVAFSVRDVGIETGRRIISNLNQVQIILKKTQHIHTSTENVTFEHLDVSSTIRYMAGVHVFISVHGAGMTNMFFMNPGSAVVEIIPYPLCNCRSPDYFYGIGGYYHGSSIAQGIKHYPYCVPQIDTKWLQIPKDISPGSRCSWKHLHAVDSVFIDPTMFVSLMRLVERDLIAIGTIKLTEPIIHMSPHANG